MIVPTPVEAECSVEAVVSTTLSARLGQRLVSPLVAAALLMKPRPHLTAQQGEKVDALKVACPDFARMRILVMSFRGILLGGQPESLAGWIAKAADSGIYAMTRFARSLQQDWEPVQNAVAESWSNGPVERACQSAENSQAPDVRASGIHLIARSPIALGRVFTTIACTESEEEPRISGKTVKPKET